MPKTFTHGMARDRAENVKPLQAGVVRALICRHRQLRTWLQKTAKHETLNAHRRRPPPANSVLIETALGGAI
ncbi:MAG: hypothetical protein HY287_07295 [Planctomycetes bacterium]|nr:hypothetical protein [Planctomycetota bacterium]